jgi:ribonuclease P protein component
MVRRRTGTSLAGRIRRQGGRVSGGPWTLCGLAGGTGRVIVALGAAAGGAVTRSRIRRIARTVLSGERARAANMDLLLLARSAVGDRPRRQVRRELAQLLARLPAGLPGPRGTQAEHG